jgi:DNA-directed RNA polymerase specialized sigma subunit
MTDDVKAFLNYIKTADIRIKNKLVEEYQLRCLATSITAPTDSESIMTSGVTDRVGDIVPKIVQVQEEINNMIDHFIDEKQKRVNLIDLLQNDLEYQVCHMHYVEYKDLTDVASELGYSYAWILEVHKNAINNLCQPYLNLYGKSSIM